MPKVGIGAKTREKQVSIVLCSIDHITSIACAIAVITLGMWIKTREQKITNVNDVGSDCCGIIVVLNQMETGRKRTLHCLGVY